MLTKKELQWLKARRLRQAKHHIYHRNEYFIWSGYHFAKDEIADLKDALEFSERVAAKLARWDNEYHKGDHLCPYGDDDLDSYIPLCHCINFCQDHPKLGCIAAKLAWARIAVEEEMDDEQKP